MGSDAELDIRNSQLPGKRGVIIQSHLKGYGLEFYVINLGVCSFHAHRIHVESVGFFVSFIYF